MIHSLLSIIRIHNFFFPAYLFRNLFNNIWIDDQQIQKSLAMRDTVSVIIDNEGDIDIIKRCVSKYKIFMCTSNDKVVFIRVDGSLISPSDAIQIWQRYQAKKI